MMRKVMSSSSKYQRHHLPVTADPMPGGAIFEQIESSGVTCIVTMNWAKMAFPNMKKTLSGIPMSIFQRKMRIMSAIAAKAPMTIDMAIPDLNFQLAKTFWYRTTEKRLIIDPVMPVIVM